MTSTKDGAPEGARIEPMTTVHGPAVLEIYQAGMDGGDATFETTAPTWEEFDTGHLVEHRFVAVDTDGRSGAVAEDVRGKVDRLLGWAAVVPYSPRAVYRGVVEVSVYVHPCAQRRGIGRRLLAELLASTDAAGIWTVQAAVFPENTASLALHTSAGFREVGRRERIGRRDDRWRDVVLLERRTAGSPGQVRS